VHLVEESAIQIAAAPDAETVAVELELRIGGISSDRVHDCRCPEPVAHESRQAGPAERGGDLDHHVPVAALEVAADVVAAAIWTGVGAGESAGAPRHGKGVAVGREPPPERRRDLGERAVPVAR
jgi:hypothetical protein